MKMSKVDFTKILAASLSAMLCVALCLNTASAADAKNAASESAPLTQPYVWYDGDRERQVWMDPHAVAEFDPGPQGESSVKHVSPGAGLMHVKRKQAAVRLWQLSDDAGTAIRNLKSLHPRGRYSAILRDAPDSTGRMRALPGNIIVYLNPQWDQTAVNNWLGEHKLEIVKQLRIGPNIYVIKTGPGMEALDTANALYRSGEVKAAFPDWWQEVTTR